jgi:alanine dehydrogenase
MPETLVLNRSDVASLLDYSSCIDAVENAFRAYANNEVLAPGAIGTHVNGGGFHVKTAGLMIPRAYYATKTNGNFPDNPTTTGLPTIQGVISLHDADDGRLLAVMDSMEITTIRTAAASAVAAKYLAREDAKSLLIIGCGNQGRSHLRALSHVRKLDHVVVFDMNESLSARFANEMGGETGVPVTAATNWKEASQNADIIATTTPSKAPFLHAADVSPGAFIAAVGADSDTKHEIAPDVFASSTVVVDILEQAAGFGDLHHAIKAGVITRDEVYSDIGSIVSGARRGRQTKEEIILFDSTGTALQDVASAALVYERAKESGRGLKIDFGS